MEKEKIYELGEKTNIVCIDCLKGKIEIIDDGDPMVGQCDHCSMLFEITGKNQYRYL